MSQSSSSSAYRRIGVSAEVGAGEWTNVTGEFRSRTEIKIQGNVASLRHADTPIRGLDVTLNRHKPCYETPDHFQGTMINGILRFATGLQLAFRDLQGMVTAFDNV
jgi:hypothetical protein